MIEPKEHLKISSDYDLELARVPNEIAECGVELARVQAELSRREAEYRNWRARVAASILENEPKLAEAKIKARIESMADYLRHKERIASLEEKVGEWWAYYEAFKRKADVVRTLAVREREGLGAYGSRETVTEVKAAAKREKVKAAMRRRPGRTRPK